MSDNKLKNADEPAFPGSEEWMWGGISKREYFAGLAMQGMMARGTTDPKFSVENTPYWAVKCADLLLAELEKSP